MSHTKHEFTALWWNLGKYGRQDLHLHSCFAQSCNTVLVGEGTDCNANEPHVRRTLGVSKNHWSCRCHEGETIKNA